MIPEWRQLQVVNGARSLLSSLALAPNAIVIFDIDDTLIAPSGRPYVHIIDLYNEVKARGVHVGLITARPGYPSNVDFTFQQLAAVGVTDWSVAYFRSPDKRDVQKYKTNARKNVWDRGYHIVMTVGDQEWDHGQYGGFAVMVR